MKDYEKEDSEVLMSLKEEIKKLDGNCDHNDESKSLNFSSEKKVSNARNE